MRHKRAHCVGLLMLSLHTDKANLWNLGIHVRVVKLKSKKAVTIKIGFICERGDDWVGFLLEY